MINENREEKSQVTPELIKEMIKFNNWYILELQKINKKCEIDLERINNEK